MPITLNVNFEAMKEKYLEILEKHLPENYLIEEIADELLNLHSVSQQRELFEIISDRLLSELGAELSMVTKEDLIKIISNCG